MKGKSEHQVKCYEVDIELLMFTFRITELSSDCTRWGMSRGEAVKTGCKVFSSQKPSPKEE